MVSEFGENGDFRVLDAREEPEVEGGHGLSCSMETASQVGKITYMCSEEEFDKTL